MGNAIHRRLFGITLINKGESISVPKETKLLVQEQ